MSKHAPLNVDECSPTGDEGCLPPKSWRFLWILPFSIGILIGVMAASVRSGAAFSEDTSPRPGPLSERLDHGFDRRSLDQSQLLPKNASRYAFIQMAYSPPNSPPAVYLWRTVAMARAVQRISIYPLVLLTNETHFPDGTDIAVLGRLGVQVLPVQEIYVPPQIESLFLYPTWRYAFWKLQIFRLTQFEKLIWLDTDAILYRSIDWLFQREPVWGQRNNWWCRARPRDKFCSGLMLIRPNESTFQDIQRFARTLSDCKFGDQELLERYYRDVSKRPIRLLKPSIAAFGHCINEMPASAFLPYGHMDPHKDAVVGNDTALHLLRGPWSLPAYVHKSSAGNECFDYDLGKQIVKIGGIDVNVCHQHPLGSYWRDAFCSGIAILRTGTPQIKAFCDDRTYYGTAAIQTTS